MVGPSITDEDRKRFLRRLKIGFSLLVGVSMGLVTLYSGAPLVTVAMITVGATAVGGVLGWLTIPDSISEMPYDATDRGPKPGERTKARRSGSDNSPQRAADGEGRESRQSRD